MPPMRCPPDHELLPLATGETAPPELDRHLAGCRDCTRRLERLRAEVADLRQSASLTSSKFLWPEPAPGVPPPPAADSVPPTAPGDSLVTGVSQGPQDIGRYRVVRLLGEGGQAWVYLVFHRLLGKELVLKLSRKRVADDRTAHDRLSGEGRMLADLDHPALARVYDLDVHDGRPFLVMEYVRGRSLEQYARHDRPAPRLLAQQLAQVARGLAAAHRRGVVHQDLKPNNILVDDFGRPRIIDFGMARIQSAWAGDRARRPSLCGTPEFMPPEQARGEDVDPRGDVFALGAVLYFLLTGKAPYDSPDTATALRRARQCDFDRAAPRARGAPRGLARVCLKAMAAEPGRRYANAEAMARDLEHYARRPRRLLLVTGVVLAAGLVAALLYRFPPGRAPREVRLEPGHAALVNDLPLRPQDRVAVRCDFPRTPSLSAAALFWVTPDGRLERQVAGLSLWRDDDGLFLDRLACAPEGRAAGGTQLVLVCATAKPQLPDWKPLEELFAPQRPWPELPPDEVVVLTQGRVKSPRHAEAEGPRPEAVRDMEKRLAELHARCKDRFEFVAATAFSW